MDQHQLDQLTDQIRVRLDKLEPIGGTVVLDLGDNVIFIDGRGESHVVGQTDIESDCRIRLAPDLLSSILAGERSGFAAFMTGKISARGDMSVAVKLRGLLSGG